MSKDEFDKFESNLRRALRTLASPSYMKEIGEKARELIYNRTKLGDSVEETGGEKKKLKKLSPSYKDQRAGKVAFITKKAKSGNVVIPIIPKNKPSLHGTTTAGKSNLTFTGQMLDSIKVLLSTGKVSIKPTGGRNKSDLDNLEVAELVSKERPFNNLSRSEIKQMQNFVAELLKILTKNL